MDFKIGDEQMEKGFNDDELADIMNEIESLEQEFSDEVAAVASENEETELSAEQEFDDAQDEDYYEPKALEEANIDSNLSEESDELVMGSSELEEFQDEEETSMESDQFEDIEDLEEEAEEFDSFLDEGLNEVLEDLTEMPVESIIPQKSEEDFNNVHHLRVAPIQTTKEITPVATSTKLDTAQSTMSFKVSGDMTIELNFSVAGQDISITVNEQSGLVIGVPGGGQFTLPVNSKAVKKVS